MQDRWVIRSQAILKVELSQSIAEARCDALADDPVSPSSAPPG